MLRDQWSDTGHQRASPVCLDNWLLLVKEIMTLVDMDHGDLCKSRINLKTKTAYRSGRSNNINTKKKHAILAILSGLAQNTVSRSSHAFSISSTDPTTILIRYKNNGNSKIANGYYNYCDTLVPVVAFRHTPFTMQNCQRLPKRLAKRPSEMGFEGTCFYLTFSRKCQQVN